MAKSSGNTTKTTTDHDTIRQWAEARGGTPVTIKETGDEENPGTLRIAFQGHEDTNDSFEEISWDAFFDKFDQDDLALLYQDRTSDGQESRFYKIVSQETARQA